ncbi:hypothetical protein GCM10028805_43220 [Spirosoma harenae]
MNKGILPYAPAFEADLLALERACPQGSRMLQMVMERPQFITRSAVFDRYDQLTYWINNRLVSVSACAETRINLNGEPRQIGFHYDARTHPDFRNRGLQGLLTRRLLTEFSQPTGLTQTIVTFKANNLATLLLGKKEGGKSLYNFTYLTVPTRSKISSPAVDQLRNAPFFSTDLLSGQEKLREYYTRYIGTLGVWHLEKVYQLRVVHLASWLRIVKKFVSGFGQQHTRIPSEGQTLRMRLLMGFQAEHATVLNDLLADMAQQGIDYLLVATHPNDGLYHWLRPYAIDTTNYSLLADFAVQPTDQLTLDVRCL